MNPKAYFDVAIEIIGLATKVIEITYGSRDNGATREHFDAIGKLAAEHAAKPEIQGYSEHG